MASTLDVFQVATDIEDAFLKNLKKSQDAVVQAAQIVGDIARPVVRALPVAPAFADQLPTAHSVVEHVNGFTDKLIAARGEYFEQLLGTLPTV